MKGLDPWLLAAGFGLGVGLGGLYFGGLWFTVRRVPGALHPRRLWLASFVARMGALLAAFYAMTAWDWRLSASAVAGLLIARLTWLKVKGLPRASTEAVPKGGVR